MQKSDTENLDESDFEVLEKSIRETERGGWFLDEFSKRQSFSEISMLSREISKMEQRISSMLRKQIIDIVMHEISGIKAIVTRVSNKFEDGSLGQSNDYRNIIALETLKTIRKKLDNITSAYLLRHYEGERNSDTSENLKNAENADDEVNTLDDFIDEQKRFLANDLLPRMTNPETGARKSAKTDAKANTKNIKHQNNLDKSENKLETFHIHNKATKQTENLSSLSIKRSPKQDTLENEGQNQQINDLENSFVANESKKKIEGEEDAYKKFLATDFKEHEDNNALGVSDFETEGTIDKNPEVKDEDLNDESDSDEMDFSLNNFDPRFGI